MCDSHFRALLLGTHGRFGVLTTGNYLLFELEQEHSIWAVTIRRHIGVYDPHIVVDAVRHAATSVDPTWHTAVPLHGFRAAREFVRAWELWESYNVTPERHRFFMDSAQFDYCMVYAENTIAAQALCTLSHMNLAEFIEDVRSFSAFPPEFGPVAER